MKKLLTLSAILAAGTLFANAAEGDEFITLTDLSESVTGDVSYDADTGLISTGTFTSYTIYDSTSKKDVTRYTATTVINIDLTALGVSSDGSLLTGSVLSTGNVLLLEYRAGSTTNNTIGLMATSSGLCFSWAGSAWTGTNQGDTLGWATVATDSGLTPVLTNSYTVGDNLYASVALQSTARGDASSPVKGALLYQMNSELTGVASTGFAYTGLASEATYDSIYVNSSYVTGVSAYDGIISSTSIVSAAKVIPEPSMFGLLAGTLALGLAGARRRRSKK